MLTYIFVRLALLIGVCFLCWLFYWILFAPFGPSSRCQENSVIKSDGKVVARLVAVDHAMAMPMIRSHLEQHCYRIANKADLEILCGNSRLCTQFPLNARLIGEQSSGHESGIWAIDTSSQYAANIQLTRLHKIEIPSSMEDCLIVAMPCT